jgi:GxxExxY protein
VVLAHQELTEKIIAAAYAVHNELGSGFLEKVYENAMAVELRKRGIRFRAQAPLTVRYQGHVVGEYFADLLVEDAVICELKALEHVPREAEIQLVNYLAATGIDVGLLINFGKSVTIRRKFRQYEHPVNPAGSC